MVEVFVLQVNLHDSRSLQAEVNRTSGRSNFHLKMATKQNTVASLATNFVVGILVTIEVKLDIVGMNLFPRILRNAPNSYNVV
jgi:hypothetical protein